MAMFVNYLLTYTAKIICNLFKSFNNIAFCRSANNIILFRYYIVNYNVG